ncbi:acetyl-CoA hydrolase/transferase family protein [Pararhodospirillum photometricum]|uniref:Acetyl-CoA hydrolase/transferase n=1 Tax=Pararhodospirillum photometricum DSM 122 TaxID=1150469 RepID=H6SQ41_PARPM|nr:acetyl-CoA hydrolase/transferase C-terminal domain-containing protein [Pararhodospirillum photometricum]CCG09560.1 Acetyl-CoA hydrolase/transferase [Pararhodospirillum photometricum DSM 122]
MTQYDDEYQRKLVRPSDAVAPIRSGTNVILSMGVSQPPALMGALADRARSGSLTDIRVYYMHASEAAVRTLLVPDLMDVVQPCPLFMSAHDRSLAKKGYEAGKRWVHYVPCTFHHAPRLLTEHISPDVFLLTVSPMDRAGFFSLGTNSDYGATVVRRARRVIVEVNPHMPRVFGENLLHVADVDAIVEHEAPLMEVMQKEGTDEDVVIGRMIADQIPDGATLQMGIGGVPNAVMNFLANHNDMGLHSELFSPPMVELIRKGVLNGRRKNVMPYKHVFTLALGDKAMYEFMNDNPSIVGYPVMWVNNPSVIRKNDTMISVNSAIEIDLTGQINSESLGGVEFSGPGGQLDFIRGAYASKGGKSFIALHSTAKDGTLSRIVCDLSGPVTDPRMESHYVVTEYGCVCLKGLTVSERARALIGLAHPKFRDALKDEARATGLL